MTDDLVVTEAGGTITIAADVLERIVRRAAEGVDGVKVRRRGLDVTRSRVALGVDVRYGELLAPVGEKIQQRVGEALHAACGLDATIDVTIEELT